MLVIPMLARTNGAVTSNGGDRQYRHIVAMFGASEKRGVKSAGVRAKSNDVMMTANCEQLNQGRS